jgi:hypothetical protein
MFDLTGRVAVITGGNGGIGLGMARGLARAGADISIWARNEEKNAAATAELKGLGVRVQALHCDVAAESDVEAAMQATLAEFGRVDACFANAGYGAPGDPMKLSLKRWRELMSVNLDGAFLTLRAAAKHMIERGEGGRLIGISSIVEIFGAPAQAHYASSKGALGALIRSMAVRLGRHGICVNGVQPGWIITDATAPALDQEVLNDTILKRTPLRRWGTTEDMEGIAVYLASDASRFHTGDTLRVDGGYSVF